MSHTLYFQWDDRTPLINSILKSASTIRLRVERELLPKVIKDSLKKDLTVQDLLGKIH